MWGYHAINMIRTDTTHDLSQKAEKSDNYTYLLVNGQNNQSKWMGLEVQNPNF